MAQRSACWALPLHAASTALAGLLEYLEDIIGTSRFVEPLVEMCEALEKLNEERQGVLQARGAEGGMLSDDMARTRSVTLSRTRPGVGGWDGAPRPTVAIAGALCRRQQSGRPLPAARQGRGDGGGGAGGRPAGGRGVPGQGARDPVLGVCRGAAEPGQGAGERGGHRGQDPGGGAMREGEGLGGAERVTAQWSLHVANGEPMSAPASTPESVHHISPLHPSLHHS